MAIDLTRVADIYSKLDELNKKSIENLIANRSITPEQQTQIIATTLNAMISVSCDTAIRELDSQNSIAIAEREIAIKEAESQNSIAIANAESQNKIDVAEREIAIKEAESTENVEIKKEQKGLITRQKTAYDDKLRIEEAKVLKDVVFSYNMGNIVIPTDLNTALLDATNGINP